MGGITIELFQLISSSQLSWADPGRTQDQVSRHWQALIAASFLNIHYSNKTHEKKYFSFLLGLIELTNFFQIN
jgi:hypothetical protein